MSLATCGMEWGDGRLLQEANWEVTSVNQPGGKDSLDWGPAGGEAGGKASTQGEGG